MSDVTLAPTQPQSIHTTPSPGLPVRAVTHGTIDSPTGREVDTYAGPALQTRDVMHRFERGGSQEVYQDLKDAQHQLTRMTETEPDGSQRVFSHCEDAGDNTLWTEDDRYDTSHHRLSQETRRPLYEGEYRQTIDATGNEVDSRHGHLGTIVHHKIRHGDTVQESWHDKNGLTVYRFSQGGRITLVSQP